MELFTYICIKMKVMEQKLNLMWYCHRKQVIS